VQIYELLYHNLNSRLFFSFLPLKALHHVAPRFEKVTKEPTIRPILAESSLEVNSYENPPTLSPAVVLQSEVEVLSSLKAGMILFPLETKSI
jgi:hypothetical protein